MKIELEYPCKCGHTAAFHENEQTNYQLSPTVEIVKIKVYTKCSHKKSWEEMQWAYTNFGDECLCRGFELDNLRYLEMKSE